MNQKKIADALRRLADAIEAQPALVPQVPMPHIAPPLTIPVTHPCPSPGVMGPWWGIVAPAPGIRVTC